MAGRAPGVQRPGPYHTWLWFQGQMQATPECFAHLTQLLQVLAGGRVCAMLEVIVATGRVHGPEAEVQL